MFSKNTRSGSATPAAPEKTTASQPSETTPVKPTPLPVGQKNTPPSIISSELNLKGNLTSTGEVQIDGVVDGNVTSRSLTVGEKGTINGSVSADSVRVCGAISGEITARNVVLAKTARVEGDVIHETLTMESGAFLDGQVRRKNPPASAESKVSVLKPNGS